MIFTENSIHDCETGWSEALSINGNVDGFEIGNNHIYNNTNIGIVAIGFEGECSNTEYDQARNGIIHNNLIHDNPSAYAECAGIYIDGASHIIVENNTLYNNNYGIEIGCENNGNVPNNPSANNILVRNNLIYNNTYTGIALGGFDYPTSGKVEYARIENNTCFNNDTENNYQGEMMISYTENSIIENNIFFTNNADNVLFISENDTNTLLLNFNLFYTPEGTENIVIEWNGTEYNTFADYKAATLQDANSLFANPLFVNSLLTNPNLHIMATSPARNAGNPAFQETDGIDIDNEDRINESLVDIGSDEFYTTTRILNVNKTHKVFCYPNPTYGIININLSNKNIKQISVFDLTGRLILNKNKTKITNTINLSEFENGVYIINIQTNKEVFTTSIIKK